MESLGHEDNLNEAAWPAFDAAAAVDEELLVVVQVNGKLRGKVTVAASATDEEIKGAALADEKIRQLIDGMNIKKVVYVPGKLVNIVVG